MSFDWAEYLVVANALMVTGTALNSEAFHRSAIGRAYYSAFNMAAAHCKHDFDNDSAAWVKRAEVTSGTNYNEHAYVRLWLERFSDPNDVTKQKTLRVAGWHLNDMRKLRNHADYDEAPALERRHAEKAVNSATLVVAALT